MGASTPDATGDQTLNSGGSLKPIDLKQDAASADDVASWNDYSTYRTNSLQAKTPYTSFEEWLAGGKVSGKEGGLLNNLATAVTDEYMLGGTGA